jgi:hypothetical protein
MVTGADPDWSRYKFREVFYIFDHRAFIENPYIQGAYDGGRSNVYPVGQQYGGLDALVQAGKAPTAGVPTPGLFSGVADGKGWA